MLRTHRIRILAILPGILFGFGVSAQPSDLAESFTLNLAQSHVQATGEIEVPQFDGLSGAKIKDALSKQYGDRASFASRGPRDADIYRKSSPAVVIVVTNDSFGSGVLVGSDQVITNWHVVKGHPSVGIIHKPVAEGAAPSEANVLRGTVAKTDAGKDLALVKVTGLPQHIRPLQLGDENDIQIGADVHAIGHPTGESWTYTKGLISQVRRDYEWKTATSAHRANVIQTQMHGQAADAATIHQRHPFQSRRQEIIDQKEFRSAQEFYFAISDILVRVALGEKADQAWKIPIEKKLSWEKGIVLEQLFQAYRSFALGALAGSENSSAATELFISAAKQRLSLFEHFLKTKFEGFQLPTSVDAALMMFGLTAASERGRPEDYDLLLNGGEMLFRDVRHQLSDFVALLGSQENEQERKDTHSYNLLVRQKREWELQHIRQLLAGTLSQDRGALISAYGELVLTTTALKDQLAVQGSYANAAGYPTVKELQHALQPNEAFIAYFRHVDGLGRLCVTRAETAYSVGAIHAAALRTDLKLLELSLTSSHAPDDNLDSEFPVAAALNLKAALFGGLERCMIPNSHLIVALPRDMSGVPLGALLSEAPPVWEKGHDLRKARWLAKDFNFTVTVSARHFLGTRKIARSFGGGRGYLGIGNPDVPMTQVAAGAEHAIGTRSAGHERFSGFAPLPETADEIASVAKLFAAPGSDTLLGGQATEDNLRRKPLGSYDIIHFATHGFLKDDIPELAEAGLMLTLGRADDSLNDGVLSASEISRLTIRARLIVLSACNTARIEQNAAGRAINDLQAAFSVAGAPTLVATLWSIETNTAHELITAFFRNWRDSPVKSASAVLRVTVRAYLERADRSHQHPRFWAPFVVFGYGGGQTDRTVDSGPLAVDEFEVVPGSTGGEVIDAKPFAGGVALSMISDWNGEKFSGTVAHLTNAGALIWKLPSYEFGAGAIAIDRESLLVGSYVSRDPSTAVVRRIGRDGKVEWTRHFPDLIGYSIEGLAMFQDHIFLAAPPVTAKDNEPLIIIKLSAGGHEVGRRKVPISDGLFVVGRRALLTVHKNELVVAAISQEEPRLDVRQRGAFGLGLYCKGSPSTKLFRLDPATLAASPIKTLQNFQARALMADQQRILLAGNLRKSCDQETSAAVLDANGATIWQDKSSFSSSAKAIHATSTELQVLVQRERALGVRSRGGTTSGEYPKRWADTNNFVYELSLVNIQPNRLSRQRVSTFGMSAFAQGAFSLQRRAVIFGTIGGHPALSLAQH